MDKKEIITTNNNPEYDRLLLNVGETLEQGRQQAVYAVNSAMVQLTGKSADRLWSMSNVGAKRLNMDLMF